MRSKTVVSSSEPMGSEEEEDYSFDLTTSQKSAQIANICPTISKSCDGKNFQPQQVIMAMLLPAWKKALSLRNGSLCLVFHFVANGFASKLRI